MARKLKSDKLLFTATVLLVCTSVVMVYSASAFIAMENQGDPYLYLFKQATWAVLGLALVPVMMRIDYRTYRQPIVIWTGLAVVSIALVAVLFGHARNGANRWLGFGSLGVHPRNISPAIAATSDGSREPATISIRAPLPASNALDEISPPSRMTRLPAR